MEPQELIDTLHETFKTINARIAALEIVHTRYQGPKGPKGDKGDSGPAGRDGKDSGELDALREERAEFREEKNNFRKELHDFRTALVAELQEISERIAAELASVYEQEVNSFCSMRDHACQELAALAGPQGPQGTPGPQGERGPIGKPGDISAAISAAVAGAEAEAKRVVQEALAKIHERLEQLEQATK